MDEAINGNAGQDVSSQPVSSVTQSAEISHTAPDERTFRQSEVDNIVKKVKHDAVESYKRMSHEQPQYAREKYGEESRSNASKSFSEDDYRRVAAEEAQKYMESVRQEAFQKSQDEMAQRTVQNFYAKTQTGKNKYQDFDSVTGDIDLAKFPNVVQLLAEYVDNSEDVYYELGKNRFNMLQLELLAEKSPKDAITQAKRLSQSLKDNASAVTQKFPNEPLSQLKPSTTGTDNGAMTVTDYRKKYRG